MTKLTYNVIMLYNIDKKLSFKFFIWVAFCFAKNRLFGVPLSLQPLPSLRWLVLNIYSPMNVKFARALSFGKYGLL